MGLGGMWSFYAPVAAYTMNTFHITSIMTLEQFTNSHKDFMQLLNKKQNI